MTFRCVCFRHHWDAVRIKSNRYLNRVRKNARRRRQTSRPQPVGASSRVDSGGGQSGLSPSSRFFSHPVKSRPDVWNRALAVLPGAVAVLGLACGVISLSLYGPVAARSPEFDEWFVKGNQLAAEHNYEKAIAAFQHAARLNPKNPDPYFAMGMVRRDQQDWPQAVTSFTEFAKRSPNNPDGWWLLGKCRQQSNDLPGAIEAFEKAQKLSPRNAAAPFALGMIWLQKSDWSRAESAFSEVVDRTPGNTDGWTLLGRCRESLNNISGAKQAYRKALALNPDLVEPAAALRRLGDT